MTERVRHWSSRIAPSGANVLVLCALFSGCHALPLRSVIESPHEARPPVCALGAPQAATARGQMAESGPQEQVIDLETALKRAGLDNPTIALAEEAVRERLAERMQA